MRTAWIAAMMRRELTTVKEQLAAYPDEAGPWRKPDGIGNPGGNLALHVIGNLNHFVGAVLGGTGYVRDRDSEFTRRDVPRAEIAAAVNRTIPMIEETLARLDDADLERDYPQPLAGHAMATGDFLTHLAVHLAYHVGQIDYHRRTVTGQARATKALAISELETARPVGD